MKTTPPVNYQSRADEPVNYSAESSAAQQSQIKKLLD